MSEHGETLAEIVAEMRKRMKSHYYSREGRNLMRQYSDRIEEAYRYEMSKTVSKNGADFGQLGNAAVMREALANLVDVIDRCDSGSPLWWHSGAKGVKPLKDAKAALSAPPRNCDVGTAEEQAERFIRFCQAAVLDVCSKSCPLYDHSRTRDDCAIQWSQMPYEEGGVR